MSHVSFSDLRTGAYCLRQLYYERGSDREVPDEVREKRRLAFRYEGLLAAGDAELAGEPIAVAPATFRENLRRSRERIDPWPDVVDPPDREVFLTGKDCRGQVPKVVRDPPRPTLVSSGRPPERGVWEPDAVWAVAAAKALAWERERGVEAALVEYPAHGVVRRVRVTTERAATYRRVLRSVRAMDGPPPREGSDGKCEACEYSGECGVRTRSLRSLLG